MYFGSGLAGGLQRNGSKMVLSADGLAKTPNSVKYSQSNLTAEKSRIQNDDSHHGQKPTSYS